MHEAANKQRLTAATRAAFLRMEKMMTTQKEKRLQAEMEELQSKYDKLLHNHKFAGQVIHNLTVANQAAWIEWQHGRGAEHGMQWVHNGLFGPGLIPDEEAEHGKDAQRWYDANTSYEIK